MRQRPAREREELGVVIDSHHLLGDRERDDLRIRHATPSVLTPFRQEIVSGAEHRHEQQVEVGEHRGPPRSTALLSTADFDPAAEIPYPTALPAVESII